MYQSDIEEVSRGFFTAVQKRAHMCIPADEVDGEAYNFTAEVTGMVRLVEEILKEEEK